jgi:hypothetical protein
MRGEKHGGYGERGKLGRGGSPATAGDEPGEHRLAQRAACKAERPPRLTPGWEDIGTSKRRSRRPPPHSTPFRKERGAIGQQREQLHPARIDTGERLVRGRGQARDGPVGALGPARDGDAGGAVEAEAVEDVLRLRAAEELLEAGGVFEALFEGFGAVRGIQQVGFAFHPCALLLSLKKLAQTFDVATE